MTQNIEITKALIKLQGILKNPSKSAENPFYKSKYTPLDQLINHIKPSLSDCGLTLVQHPVGENGQIGITTILMHESGESIERLFSTIIPKNDPQSIGSAITYFRRYAIQAILNISSEDDDDANTHTDNKASKPEPMTDDQREEIKCLLADTDSDEAKFFDFLGVTGFDAMTQTHFTKAVNALNKKRGQK